MMNQHFEVGQVLDMSAAEGCGIKDTTVHHKVIGVVHQFGDRFLVKIRGNGKHQQFTTDSSASIYARILPQIFIRKDSHGMAVIRAKSPVEALKLLRSYEGEDEFLSFKATDADFVSVAVAADDKPLAVLAHMSN